MMAASIRLEDEIYRGPINDYEDKFFSRQYRKVENIPMVFVFHGLGSDYSLPSLHPEQ